MPATSALAQSTSALRQQALALFGRIEPVSASELQQARVTLGQVLFWDARLSLDGKTACASCHFADSWGADPRSRSPNARGELTHFNSMSIFNTQTAPAGLRWLADRRSGAEQAIGSITGSMGFAAREDLLPVLAALEYTAQFSAAFPDTDEALSIANYGAALEAYQRTLRTPAPFDDWLGGNDAALDAAQLRGLGQFVALGCAGCHSGALLGGGSLQRFGITGDYPDWTGSQEHDRGLMEVSSLEADRNRFRVQPLRNVAMTAPYFHDGSVGELRDAVAIMAAAQLGRELSAAEVDDIVAFLAALTGSIPANFTAPRG